MFPIAIIAGVIGAVVSTAAGCVLGVGPPWIVEGASSAGGKADAKSQADAKPSPSFEAALAAQVTGQSVPASTATATPRRAA